MQPSAYDLKEYYLTPQGRAVVGILRARFAALWAQGVGEDAAIVGAGYALPYLEAFADVPRAFALFSAGMGGFAWPDNGVRCALVQRGAWPLLAASVDGIIMVHELEYAEDPSAVLEEAWRVLKPEGRLLLVVPNRTGLWARAEDTPFGHGCPFTAKQVQMLLQDAHFVVVHSGGALVAPPVQARLFNKHVAPGLEVAARLCSALCGVVVVEATKRLYAPAKGKLVREGRKRPALLPETALPLRR